ncbi:Casparian strip membrane protein domain-containing protein [Dioscorea alata]|uniref:Casparian strip membrane protein domain-containing protein n=1 Tax=Dioscorea alata TaxID=55571 RepID=A0ACB7U8L2_DIOAL|nr:Casparian strip membrane protein domain-containing protein [Dioscorea alata]
MAKRRMDIILLCASILMLRTITFIFLIISIVILTTDSIDLGDTKGTFKVVHAYRYVLSVAVIGCAYTLLQLPFATYYAFEEKHMIRDDLLLGFFHFADLVVALLFATGVGAGFGITVEAKIYVGKDFKELDDFLDKILISTGFLLGATITLAIIVLLKK